MDDQENAFEDTVQDHDPRVMELLGHYANGSDEAWLTRKDCGESPTGPRTWNKLHGWLVARGLLEPGFSGENGKEIPTPGYRITRAGRQEIARRASA